MTAAAVDLTLTFHGPFQVGGSGQPGIDRALDREVLLPGSSLKGLLRAEARERLGVPGRVLAEVFGSAGGRPSPWWFSDASLDPDQVIVGRRARIRRNDAGMTERGFLMIGETVWATQGTCRIEPTSEQAQPRHRLVLRAAARSISALGGERRRGFGWVSITDQEDWTEADTAAFLGVRSMS